MCDLIDEKESDISIENVNYAFNKKAFPICSGIKKKLCHLSKRERDKKGQRTLIMFHQ